ncbi:MAG TPA: hypothetical protein IAC98_05390 [Candidatus Cryptobacteroides pullicola]|nr:hypothetical protein [Candidatus Cryptobacteroides pullicola]
MKPISILTCPLVLAALLTGCSAPVGDEIPLVYSEENTGASYALAQEYPATGLDTPVMELPDPLAWASGKGRVKDFNQWERRRNEIFSQIQFYETGTKPVVDRSAVSARMSGDTLYVDVTVDGETLSLSSRIFYPDGDGPFPLMIGTSRMSLPREIFDERPIALMDYNERQVVNYGQWGPRDSRGSYAFDRLYPELVDNGAYVDWAWGLSRIIDGLQILGPEVTRIDVSHIGVTGCSYAGKMALFCGAFDERIALTIAQEPGGGGAAAWRVSHNIEEECETLERTDYNWFKESLRENFSGDRVYNLPYDRHALCAMVCPRALLILGNTDYPWLADEAGYVSAVAARKVWEEFGIADRMGYSINGGHPHCMLPESQYPEVEAFIDRFLLGKNDVNTTVLKAEKFEGTTDLARWIKY